MPRLRKPAGWPRFMRSKKLKDGTTGYYWEVPSAYPNCPIDNEALGADYGAAKERCDKTLNPMFDAWRMGKDLPAQGTTAMGSFDWLVAQFQDSPQYRRTAPKTQSDYDKCLKLVQEHICKDGRRFGELPVKKISPAAADVLYEKLKIVTDPVTGESRSRIAMANASMRAARRAWKVVWRKHKAFVPETNPFSAMGLEATSGGNEAATREHLQIFAEQAIGMGLPSLAIAAYIGFEWLQREADILSRIAWTFYRSAERPDAMKIRHHKTGAWMFTPLTAWDEESGAWVPLYPELEAMLAETPRTGSLMVMRDKPFRRGPKRKQADDRNPVYKPWVEDTFRHHVRVVMDAAGLPKSLTFTSFRHGGMTELGDSDLTDSQIMSLSAHKDPKTVRVYDKMTMVKRETAALKRLRSRTGRAAARTKRADFSE